MIQAAAEQLFFSIGTDDEAKRNEIDEVKKQLHQFVNTIRQKASPSGENQTEKSASIRGFLRPCGLFTGFHLSDSLQLGGMTSLTKSCVISGHSALATVYLRQITNLEK